MTGEKKPIYYFDPLVKINIDSEVVDIFREKRISVIDEKEDRAYKIAAKKSGMKDYWNIASHTFRKTHGNWLKALGTDVLFFLFCFSFSNS